jgi:hypothetical protein
MWGGSHLWHVTGIFAFPPYCNKQSTYILVLKANLQYVVEVGIYGESLKACWSRTALDFFVYPVQVLWDFVTLIYFFCSLWNCENLWFWTYASLWHTDLTYSKIHKTPSACCSAQSSTNPQEWVKSVLWRGLKPFITFIVYLHGVKEFRKDSSLRECLRLVGWEMFTDFWNSLKL